MTKQELKEYHWIKLNIAKLEQRIEELESLAAKQTTRLKSDADARASNKTNDRLGDIVAEIGDLREKLNEELARAYATVTRIEKAIESLPDREKYLIRARYIDCHSWEQIAVDMNYSWKQTHRIHAKALKELA